MKPKDLLLPPYKSPKEMKKENDEVIALVIKLMGNKKLTPIWQEASE